MKKHIITISLLFLAIFISCTDPYVFQTDTFEDAIVIEATITNELKKQEIKISRTFQLEEKEPTIETGATVYITDDLGNQYNFVENNEKYESVAEFQAMPERQYQLFIETSNGKQYYSTAEKLTTNSNLTEINATLKNQFGVDGVEITANSNDPTNSSKYYRFEYEETYKIVTPYWTEEQLNLSYNPANFVVTIWITPKNYDSSVCYNTEYSNEIILENTSNLSEDVITDFPVRFIPQHNSIIAYRYSILVKQYVQSIEAYTFYNTLKDLSSTASVLSPKQAGFIQGNIKNSTDNSERVIGFFDVSSVSKKRLFFNYNDFFEGEANPNYPFDCYLSEYSQVYPPVNCNANPPPKSTPLYCSDGLYALYQVYQYEMGIYYNFANESYTTTRPICGECNRLWSTEVPPFWE